MRSHDQEGFQPWQLWSENDDMQQKVHHSPEHVELLDELRQKFRSRKITHVRLLGEPGVGKTRMALELTRTEDLAPVTLYLRDSRTLRTSSFLTELIQDPTIRFVVLVVDECSSAERAEIWNVLRSRTDRVLLITIDNGPDDSGDEKMRIVQVRPTDEQQIVAILEDYEIGKNEARRWAEVCQGCPRVAHVFGANLRQDRANLLQPPATVNVWERFVTGNDAGNPEEVHLRKIVLRYASLFERFGFASPVEDEAKYIARLASNCDSRLTWPRFQSIVATLKSRHIIQGETTRYITPRALQVHLNREFWHEYGAGFDIAAEMKNMPGALQHWFIRILKYAHDSKSAQAAIERLLGEDGIIPAGSFPDNQVVGRLLLSLAEASPKATVRCLQRTIGKADVDALLGIRESRQYLVWALARTAVWKDLFAASAELLLDLAVAENAKNSNNATGTFVDLFSLVPGKAATEASGTERLCFLRSILESDIAQRRRIALAALNMALSSRGGMRMVGPEHQGLRPTIEFWFPSTGEELLNTYREAWTLLAERLDVWQGEERREVVRSLIKSAGSALHVPPLSSEVLEYVELLAKDEHTELKQLIEFVSLQLKYRLKNLEPDIVSRLRSLKIALDGHDFRSRLRRFVKNATREDYFDPENSSTIPIGKKLQELAQEAAGSTELLQSELGWLMCEESSAARCFAYHLGKHDAKAGLMPKLIAKQESLADKAGSTFLSGYLASVFERNPSEWESFLLSIAERPSLQPRFSDIVISSGMTDAVANKVMEFCRAGRLDVKRLEQWSFSGWLNRISEPVFLDLTDLQLVNHRHELWDNAVRMLVSYYMGDDSNRPLPCDLAFRALTFPAMAEQSRITETCFHWSRLAAAFVGQYPDRKWELFRTVLRLSDSDSLLLTNLDMSQERVLGTLFKSNSDLGWDCIAEVIGTRRSEVAFAIQTWLVTDPYSLNDDAGPALLQYVSISKLFDWVDEDQEIRADWLIRALPKLLDLTPAGRLTRDFIAKYGKLESVRDALKCHFLSGAWQGLTSAHHRRLREQAIEWLVGENDQSVIRWTRDYIDCLDRTIEREEIKEERRF